MLEQTLEQLNQQLGTALARRALCDEEITTVRASIQGFNVAVATMQAEQATAAQAAKEEAKAAKAKSK